MYLHSIGRNVLPIFIKFGNTFVFATGWTNSLSKGGIKYQYHRVFEGFPFIWFLVSREVLLEKFLFFPEDFDHIFNQRENVKENVKVIRDFLA